ncbi:MAG: DivIVA domain-containing protein [Coriobacteriia bacterium]|nr:DivIVA domain-containing protein [Coriobacteriia bacterium]
MKLTPLDIHHKEFGHALRGYNEAEVDAFLDQVADELERLFKENIDLSERIDGLDEKVRGYQDMERTLHNTLVSAQKSADEIIGKAQQEAAAVLKDAEVKAKEVIHSALTSKQKAVGDLTRIKQAEEAFRAEFRRLLETHLSGIAEISLPEDVTLMVGTAGDETIADADVSAPRASARPATIVVPTDIVPPAPATADAPIAEEPPEAGFVASLHLGDVAESGLRPDDTVSFDVAEFGFGEREDDVDIEEID